MAGPIDWGFVAITAGWLVFMWAVFRLVRRR